MTSQAPSSSSASWLHSSSHLPCLPSFPCDSSLDSLSDSTPWCYDSSLSSLPSASPPSLFDSPISSLRPSPSHFSSPTSFTFPPPSAPVHPLDSSPYPPPHCYPAPPPSQWTASPTSSPPSSDFTSPRSSSSASSTPSSSTPASPLPLHDRRTHVFSHGQMVAFSGEGAAYPRKPIEAMPYHSSIPPPVFSSSRPTALPLPFPALPRADGGVKERRVTSIRRGRKESGPLLSSHRPLPPPSPLPSGPVPPFAASAVSSHPAPPPKRKSNRKFGVMIDVPIKPSPSSTSSKRRIRGGEGAVVATVSPLQGERSMGGGVAVAAALEVTEGRGELGEGHLAALQSFDGRPTQGMEGHTRSNRGGGFPSTPVDAVDLPPHALPPQRLLSSPMAPTPQPSDRGRFTPSSHGESPTVERAMYSFPSPPQRAAPAGWSDFPFRALGEGGGGSRQSSASYESQYSGPCSPPFPAAASISPSREGGGLSRGGAAYLDEATSTAVLSSLAASLSHLHRTSSAPSAPSPLQLPPHLRGRGEEDRRGSSSDRGDSTPPALLPALHPAVLLERQQQLLRQLKQSSHSTALSFSPEATTAFLAALSAQMQPSDCEGAVGGFTDRPPSSSTVGSGDFSSATPSGEREWRYLQAQITAHQQQQQQQVQQRLQQHQRQQRLNARGGEGGGYVQREMSVDSASPAPPLQSHLDFPTQSRLASSASQHGIAQGHGRSVLRTACPLAASTGCQEQFSSLTELQRHYIYTHI